MLTNKRYVSGTLRFTNGVNRTMEPNNESDSIKNSESHDSLSLECERLSPRVSFASESLSERVIRAKSSGSPYRNQAPPGRILRRHIYGSVSHGMKSRTKRAAPGEKPG